MCTLLRFPLEQCRPVAAVAARGPGEVVIFPGVRIERDIVVASSILVREADEERLGV